eukprot:1371899-Rhodomonas_salina.1
MDGKVSRLERCKERGVPGVRHKGRGGSEIRVEEVGVNQLLSFASSISFAHPHPQPGFSTH